MLKHPLISPSIGQRQQLREMDQAADQQRDTDQQPQLLFSPCRLHTSLFRSAGAKINTFLRLSLHEGRNIHARTEKGMLILHPGIQLHRTILLIHLLPDSDQGRLKGLIAQAIHPET